MSRSLQKWWPSNQVSAFVLARVALGDVGPRDVSGSGLPCPTPACQGTWTTRSRRGLHYYACSQCDASDDHVGWFMRATGVQDVAAVLKVLAAKGITLPKTCRHPAVLRSYQKNRDARRGAHELRKHMSHSQLTRHVSEATAYLGFVKKPHHRSLWWTVSAPEIRQALGGPNGDPAVTGLAIPFYASRHQNALVTVLYTPDGRNFVRYQVPGAPTGVGFLSPSALATPRVSPVRATTGDAIQYGLITADPVLACTLQALRTTVSEDPASVFLADAEGSVLETARLLQDYIPKKIVYTNYHTVTAFELRLARRLNADFAHLVVSKTETEIHTVVPWRTMWRNVLENCRDLPWKLLQLLTDLRWTPEAAKEIAAMSSDLKKQIIGVLAPTPRGTVVKVGSTLELEETADGWFDARTGDVLVEAVPVVTRVYRKNGRVRHAGFVRYKGREYPFDTTKFRKNAAAVVEAAIVRHVGPGMADEVAQPHPGVVPHMASIALWLAARGEAR